MISQNGFFYGLGFAAINAAEAVVIMSTLGRYSPCWTLAYARWHTLRKFRRGK